MDGSGRRTSDPSAVVHRRPALDLDRVVLGGQLVGTGAVLPLAWALRRRG